MAWGQYAALHEFLGHRTIDVTITYRGKGYLTHSPSEHTNRCPIEVFSHGSTDAVDPDGARQSARELKRIAEALNTIVRRLPPAPPQTPEQMKATMELIKVLYSADE